MKRAIFLSLVVAAVMAAAGDFTPPAPQHARTYPAHEARTTEKLTVAADPYDTRQKAAIFETPFLKNDFLPIYLVISNDGEGAVSVVNLDVELVTADKTKIRPATENDLYRRMARLKRRGDEPSRNPLPIPLPRPKPGSRISKDQADEIVRARFQARAIEPHSNQAGFLFFDIQDVKQPLAGARLYVSGLRNAEGEELLYFEIALDQYVQSQK